MKRVSQDEIDEFMAKYAKNHPTTVLWQGTVEMALKAALRVRKARKKARRRGGAEAIAWLHDDYEIVRLERREEEGETAVIVRLKAP